MQPDDGADIEEDQFFLLRLNGAAVESSVTANAWCEVEASASGSRSDRRRDCARGAVKARRIEKAQAERTLVLPCERPLPNGAHMRVVWGKGIAAASNPKIATTIEQRFRSLCAPR